MKALTAATIVDLNVEATRQRDQHLTHRLVRVTPAFSPPWNVIEVIDALDVEGDVHPALDEGEIAALIVDLR